MDHALKLVFYGLAFYAISFLAFLADVYRFHGCYAGEFVPQELAQSLMVIYHPLWKFLEIFV